MLTIILFTLYISDRVVYFIDIGPFKSVRTLEFYIRIKRKRYLFNADCKHQQTLIN